MLNLTWSCFSLFGVLRRPIVHQRVKFKRSYAMHSWAIDDLANFSRPFLRVGYKNWGSDLHHIWEIAPSRLLQMHVINVCCFYFEIRAPYIRLCRKSRLTFTLFYPYKIMKGWTKGLCQYFNFRLGSQFWYTFGARPLRAWEIQHILAASFPGAIL